MGEAHRIDTLWVEVRRQSVAEAWSACLWTASLSPPPGEKGVVCWGESKTNPARTVCLRREKTSECVCVCTHTARESHLCAGSSHRMERCDEERRAMASAARDVRVEARRLAGLRSLGSPLISL